MMRYNVNASMPSDSGCEAGYRRREKQKWHLALCCAGRKPTTRMHPSFRSTTSASAMTARRPHSDDISFDLWPGERVAVVGPNGAGKSTLLKVVAGILAPSNGRADVYGYGAGGHICIGYVPQRSNVDWTFPVSVADVVMMGRVAKIGILRQAGRGDWQRVQDALAQVGMEEFAKRQIGELSGGQQQRVFIARALAQEAELLLMDEPLTGLDIPSQEAIFGILDQLEAARHDRARLDARSAARVREVRPADAPETRPARSWQPRRGADARKPAPRVRQSPDRACLGPKACSR